MGNGRLNPRPFGPRQAVAKLLSWFDRFKAGRAVHPDARAFPRPRQTRANVADQVAQALYGTLEVVPAVALVLDDAGKVVWANGRTTLLLGYALDEMTGTPVSSVLMPCARDERPITFASLTDASAMPHCVTRVAVARTRSGDEIEVRTTGTLSFIDGTTARVVVIVEPDPGDATGAAAQRSDQRRLHRERASEIGDMAAALAHEVDQPLTAILSNAQAAQRFLAQSPPNVGDLRELLGEVVSDSTRAHAIIRKMRKFAKREPVELRPVDLGCLVRDVVRLLHRETEAYGVALSTRIDDCMPQLSGDATQLQQVLVNLLMNAFDAVQARSVEDRAVCVNVTSSDDRSTLHIDIRDSGAGVTADQFGTLFKSFATSKPEGLGLGLSISRTLVTAHGGQLWAERNVDSGMTFHIALPAEGAVAKAARA
ncbi:MAG TPA: ATP-binding protein [Paraburkholderia sp.]|jgi:two-component system sensor kinase FixL|nr:ATP-binding protein [Paraburkholderia sp.]